MLGFSSTLITSAFSGGFKYSAIISAAFAANCLSVLTHHERWRCKQTPSLRSTRQTACTEPLTLFATAGPSHTAWPDGGGCSKVASTRLRNAWS
jgi:hypothetical protein